MLAGLIAGKHPFLCVTSGEAEHKPRLWSSGSATTVISNPIWVVQTSQAVRTMGGNSSEGTIVKKLGFFETLKNLLAKEGPGYVWGRPEIQHLRLINNSSALWRGIGPALILVMNPIIQYTAFEQLKNFLVARRTNKLRATGGAATVATLSDWDFFLLGALSKLGKCTTELSKASRTLSSS